MKTKHAFVLILLLFAIASLSAEGAQEALVREESMTLQLNSDYTFVESLYFKTHDKMVVYEGTYSIEKGKLILNAQTPVVRQFIFDITLSASDDSEILSLNWNDNSMQLLRDEHSTETENAEHVWDDGIVTTEPTCTEKGVRTHNCVICGQTYDYSITYLRHKKQDGVCSVCGEIGPYWINSAGTLKVDYPGLLDAVVEIPETVDDITVSDIGYNAFTSSATMTKVVLPNTVKTIKNYAFQKCSNLSSVTIPSSVTSFQNTIIQNCNSLNEIIYTGTIAQWNLIDKTATWATGIPATVVHCSDGDVDI